MTDKNEIIAQYLRNFAALTDKDIAEGQAFWKPRKIAKGDFFNMQSMVCNDLGLVVKEFFAFTTGIRKRKKKRTFSFFPKTSSSFPSEASSRKIPAGILLRQWKIQR